MLSQLPESSPATSNTLDSAVTTRKTLDVIGPRPKDRSGSDADQGWETLAPSPSDRVVGPDEKGPRLRDGERWKPIRKIRAVAGSLVRPLMSDTYSRIDATTLPLLAVRRSSLATISTTRIKRHIEHLT